jgi:hypothetical protein
MEISSKVGTWGVGWVTLLKASLQTLAISLRKAAAFYPGIPGPVTE